MSWIARIEQACASMIERIFGGIPVADTPLATRTLTLRVIHGTPPNQLFSLHHSPKKHSYTVGRSSKNDVTLPDPSVSRRHATIEFDAEGAIVHDLDSTNGTFVNGDRITMQRIAPGDSVRFGKTKLSVEQSVPPA